MVAALAAAAALLLATGLALADGTKAAHLPMSPKAQLGRVIFFDTGLSEPAGQSCAACHDPGRAFVDPDRSAVTSRGALPQLSGSRNTPTSMYMAFSPAFRWDEKEELYLGGQFWDGRAATLEDQARQPFVNPVEMANPHGRSVVEKVRRAAYATMFEQVYGKDALLDDD